MNDRDVEAQPGEQQEMDLAEGQLEQPAGEAPIVMPKKADLARSAQARRMKPGASKLDAAGPAATPAAKSQPAFVRTPGVSRRDESQAHPLAEPQPDELTREVEQPSAAPVRLASAHPIARARRDAAGRGIGRPLGLGGLRRGAGATRSGRWTTRPAFGRPSTRGLMGFAGLTATVAIVTALIVTLPNQPLAAAPTGSVYGVNWHKVTAAPAPRLDFGPYFTHLDSDLLMVGTVSSTTNKVVSSATTVWSTADGTTWSQKSIADSFTASGRRFVAQGASDDGQGGLVVVGNSLGSSPTDVTASAWHSRDGATWTPMAVDNATGQEMVAGVASQGGTVVTAGNGVAWVSTAGSPWGAQVLPGASTSAGSYTPRAVGSWSGGFAIIGLWTGSGPTRSAAWFSADGHNWKLAATSLAGFDLHGLAAVGSRIVAIGNDLSEAAPGLAVTWSSSDGNTWTKITPPSDQPTIGLDGGANVDGTLLAFGAPPAVATPAQASAAPTLPGSTPIPTAVETFWITEDGVNWLPITSTAAPLGHARMAAIGKRVVMVGGSATGLSVMAGDLVLGPTRPPVSPSAPPANLALSLQAGNSPMISDVTKDFTLGPLTTSKDRFLIFATGPTGTSIFSSPSGVLWSVEAASTALTATGVKGRPVVLKAVPDGQGGVIAVGKVTSSTGDTGMVWHMTTSGKWKQATFQDDTPNEFSSITSGPSGFVVSTDNQAGGSPIMYSTDNGDTWQAGAIAVGDGFALSVATYRYGYVAVGTDPARQGATTAWTSPDGRTWTIRTDWHLPPKVTALFGIGNSMVAEAATAPPSAPGASASGSPAIKASGSPLTTGSLVPSSSPSAKPTPKVTPKPTATPVPAPTTTTWWWSATGVVWQPSGLVTQGSGNMAIVSGQILVIDSPAKAGNWTAWASADGKTWRKPASDPILFAGAKICVLASLNNRLVVAGWDGPGALKDYVGQFASQ